MSSKSAADRLTARPAPAGTVRGPQPSQLDSATLLAGGNEVLIRHGAETYRLRVTRQNRLILTK